MGRGRAPCCDKSKVKRGPWSPAEDLKLVTFIQKHEDHLNWRALPKLAGLHRCGKSCRLRWVNYLRPDVKRGNFTEEEEETIIRMHAELGNKWSKIASHLPGRTDNDVKNLWNTHLKKRVQASTTTESGIDESKGSSITSSMSSADSSESNYKDKNSPTHQVKEQASTETGHDAARKDSLRQFSNENLMKTVELKELSGSENSHSDVIDASVFDNYRSLQQITTKISYGVPLFINKTSEEVNQPDISETKNVMEQPLESDFDFWGKLENIGSYQYKGIQLGDFLTSQSSSFGEVFCHEYENRKWFHQYVDDNELSLGTISYQFEAKKAAEPIPNKQIVPEQESNPGIVDFPTIWQSWTDKSSS